MDGPKEISLNEHTCKDKVSEVMMLSNQLVANFLKTTTAVVYEYDNMSMLLLKILIFIILLNCVLFCF